MENMGFENYIKRERAARMHGPSHKFYLLKPKQNQDTEQLAKEIIDLDRVKEVCVTGGDGGFMVKAKFYDLDEPDDLEKYLAKNVDPKYGAVVSHYRLKKIAVKNNE